MNKAIIIGNLTRDPEMHTANTAKGPVPVCHMTVAVSRKGEGADYFRVKAWRGLGESCGRYLTKGRKVYVSGPVSAHTYQTQSGETRVVLEINAEDVEFLSAVQAKEAETEPEYEI